MKQIIWLAALIATITVGVLSTCHFSVTETADPIVYLRAGSIKAAELEIKKTVKVSGDAHGPSNPFAAPSKFRESDWIYLNQSSGTIDANDIILTHWRDCSESIWWEHIQGTVSIQGDVVTIQLRTPSGPWEHNGSYKLERLTDAPRETDKVCGAR